MRYFLVLLLFSSILSVAEENPCEQLQKEGLTNEQLAQRGCCSWHGGVCGCNGGRALCCDGKLSPTCGCHSEDIKEFTKQNKPERVKG